MKDFVRLRKLRLLGLSGAAIGAVLVGFGASAGARDAATPPSNTSPPTISGKAQEGETLKADAGSWSGDKPMDFSYQWRRCDQNGSGCSNIGNATDQIYTVTSGDVGHRLRVVVTAVNSAGAASAVSKPTDVVAKAPAQAPRNTSAPTISGQTTEGQTLSANPGAWTGSQPIQFTYRWRRCDGSGGACQTTGVTSQTYHLDQNDVGRTLRVVVTATNSVGSSAAVSNPTAPVQAAGPPPGQCVPITSVNVPQRLVVDQVQFTPPRIVSRAQPLTARFHVVTTNRGFCVAGALVYAVGVPFDRLSAAPEVATGSDGWAQVTFKVRPTFPLRRGNLVVVFVRARKGGENLLAGVSSRRLVSVRVGAPT